MEEKKQGTLLSESKGSLSGLFRSIFNYLGSAQSRVPTRNWSGEETRSANLWIRLIDSDSSEFANPIWEQKRLMCLPFDSGFVWNSNLGLCLNIQRSGFRVVERFRVFLISRRFIAGSVVFEALRFWCVIVYVFVDGHLSLFPSDNRHLVSRFWIFFGTFVYVNCFFTFFFFWSNLCFVWFAGS